MGTWGVHSFENDDAVEWAAAYREMGLPVAESTIQIALSDHSNNSLTSDLACRAIAAVEAVAFTLGRGSAEAEMAFDGGPEPDVAAAEALISECENVMAAITGGSALKELWSAVGAAEHENWQASLTELRARLNGAAVVELAEPEAEPVESAGAAPRNTELEEIRMAIVALTGELQAMRQESSENFRRLAKRIEGLDQ